jgi:Flp pilus assembly protein TadD
LYRYTAAQIGDAKAHVSLGEAYMAIGEPDLAVRAYEAATVQAPGDATLTSKIGKALIITHDFARAVQYYESARANDPGATQMQMELAGLYIRLRRYSDAEAVLTQLLDYLSNASDPQSLEQGGAVHVEVC